MRRFRPALLLASLLLTLSPAARAERLAGRIFLGPGCRLFLEKDEGLFTQVMRSLSLIDGEAPLVDLASLMLSPNQLFLGRDHGLYYRDEVDGSVHRVGGWTSPREISLEKGVALHATRTVQEVFEGKRVDTLKVEIRSGLGPEVEPAPRADMRFWLDELLREWLPGAMTRETQQDAVVIMAALRGALPRGPTPSAAQGESLKVLQTWLDAHPYDEVPFLDRLLRSVLQSLRGQSLHGELGGEGSRTVARLVGFYEQLLAQARTQSGLPISD